MAGQSAGYDRSEPNASLVNPVVILVCVLVILSYVFSVYLYKSLVSDQLNAKEVTEMPLSLARTRAYESEELNSLKWHNKSRGQVKIPVSLAMEKVLRRYSPE